MRLKTANHEIAVLKREQYIQSAIEKEKARIEHNLRERIKELNCLYGVADLLEKNEDDIDVALQGIAELLPISWQYPEITTGRISLRNHQYTTAGFAVSPWRQSADICEAREKIGMVEVFFLEEMPTIDEGPFLREERLLIDAIAVRIGRAIERISAKRQLEVERRSLENANITLKEILTKLKEEQNEIGKVIRANVDKAIMPILHALSTEAHPEQRKYIALIERGLDDIISPFISKLSGQFMELTAAEIQIANLIRNGLSTKEIGDLRCISAATVNRHREHIRQKLGLKNKKINLATFLRTHMSE